MDRGDFNAGRSLIRRATAILPEDDPKRAALAPDLALALWESEDLAEAQRALAHARITGDPVAAAIAGIVEISIDFMTAARYRATNASHSGRKPARSSRPPTTTKGLGTSGRDLGGEKWVNLRAAETVRACDEGLCALRRAGLHRRTDDLVWWIRSAYVFGPTRVPRPSSALARSSVRREAR